VITGTRYAFSVVVVPERRCREGIAQANGSNVGSEQHHDKDQADLVGGFPPDNVVTRLRKSAMLETRCARKLQGGQPENKSKNRGAEGYSSTPRREAARSFAMSFNFNPVAAAVRWAHGVLGRRAETACMMRQKLETTLAAIDDDLRSLPASILAANQIRQSVASSGQPGLAEAIRQQCDADLVLVRQLAFAVTGLRSLPEHADIELLEQRLREATALMDRIRRMRRRYELVRAQDQRERETVAQQRLAR
jgi:hypothetical protein